MERTSEKEKKKFAKFRWYHFKCFEVKNKKTGYNRKSASFIEEPTNKTAKLLT